MKKIKITEIVILNAVKLSKRLAKNSCNMVNPYFMLKVFNTYQLGKDYYNSYLTIDRENKKGE